jgi:dinuclear metal center YbgI/SA1388 family protein
MVMTGEDKYTVKTIMQLLEEWAPPSLSESYDNVGLLVGSEENPVQGILITLDYTEEVLKEALACQCNLIIMHHPIWFHRRTSLTTKDWIGTLLLKTIKADVNLYALHTNLDKIREGVSFEMGKRLGLQGMQILQPEAKGDTGLGAIGTLPSPLPASEFLELVSDTFQCQCIRYSPGTQELIQTVAVCGGAGSFLIPYLKTLHSVDAYLTADISYHHFFENEKRFWLCDIGHYESEQFTPSLIFHFLKNHVQDLLILQSQVRTNPIHYYDKHKGI